MTDKKIQELERRIENAEKYIVAITAVLMVTVNQESREGLNNIFNEYMDNATDKQLETFYPPFRGPK